MAVQISPRILYGDFARLGDEAAAISPAADWLHVDVMDNHFVPNLTLGLPVVEALLKVAPLPLDCHLMIADPDRRAPAYAEAGAGWVTIHAEAAAAPVAAAGDTRGRRARRARRQPGHPHRALRGPARGGRHGAADVGGAGLRRPAVPRHGAAEGPPHPPVRSPGRRAARSGSRSTAAWRTRPSSAAPTRGRTCSSPARPSTGRRTRQGRSGAAGARGTGDGAGRLGWRLTAEARLSPARAAPSPAARPGWTVIHARPA